MYGTAERDAFSERPLGWAGREAHSVVPRQPSSRHQPPSGRPDFEQSQVGPRGRTVSSLQSVQPRRQAVGQAASAACYSGISKSTELLRAFSEEQQRAQSQAALRPQGAAAGAQRSFNTVEMRAAPLSSPAPILQASATRAAQKPLTAPARATTSVGSSRPAWSSEPIVQPSSAAQVVRAVEGAAQLAVQTPETEVDTWEEGMPAAQRPTFQWGNSPQQDPTLAQPQLIAGQNDARTITRQNGAVNSPAKASPASDSSKAVRSVGRPAAVPDVVELTEAERMLLEGLPPDVFVVEDVAEARRVCDLLCTQHRNRIFACDTEVTHPKSCWLSH